MLSSSQIREWDASEASFQVLPAEIGHVANTLEIAEALQHRAVLQVLVHDADLGNPKQFPVQKISVVRTEHQLCIGTQGLGPGSARPPNPWVFIMLFTYSREDLGYTQPTFGP